jgi:mannose-6-phosphate isomerase-like protein (cupin superfamily)
MKSALTFAVILTCVTVLPAADPTEPLYFSADQQKNFDKQAFSKLNPERHLGTERLMDSAFVAYRNGSGEPELHVKLGDLMLIRSGEGTVLIGGKMIGGNTTAPDEIRGKTIEGGKRYPIKAGDVLYIPANTPHQFLVDPGGNFTAMVVKITPKP